MSYKCKKKKVLLGLYNIVGEKTIVYFNRNRFYHAPEIEMENEIL